MCIWVCCGIFKMPPFAQVTSAWMTLWPPRVGCRTLRVILFHLWSRLWGKLVSVETAVPFGRLNYRAFQRQLVHELKYGRSFRRVKLAEEARDNLRWWAERRHLVMSMSVRRPSPVMVIHTDASTFGWGATCDGATLKGVWSFQEKSLHINLLEMLAVKKTILLWSNALKSKVICFRIDNVSVVFYLNKQGGTRFGSPVPRGGGRPASSTVITNHGSGFSYPRRLECFSRHAVS